MSRGRAPKGDRSGRGTRRASAAASAARNGVDYLGATKIGCDTGKWGWYERAGAKTLSKALRNSGGKGVREYLCPHCDRWHVGHLPFETKRGHRSANDVYGRD